MASCGRVVHNKEVVWRIGFYRRLGICSVLEAELWGLYEGLLAAWSIGVRCLIIESDNLKAVKLLNNRYGLGVSPSITPYIVDILDRPWTTELLHIGCEGNRVADWIWGGHG
ncbi:hypothetical protein V6N11_044028 [Hibiscus sabdariffa]|uniref:RNase H type-1 domain-containing protein n=1 Tax=Hibiscus sabdariffa TaxID=183260 RepID=A0ABR2RE33_9ROSI